MEQQLPRQVDNQACFTQVETIVSGTAQTLFNATTNNNHVIQAHHHIQRSHTPIGKDVPIDLVSLQSPKQVLVVRAAHPSLMRQVQTGTTSTRKFVGQTEVVRQEIVRQFHSQGQTQVFTTQQQQSQLPPKIVHTDVVHVQVNREETEHWRLRCSNLERQLLEMGQELTRIRSQPMQERVTYIEDTQRCVEFEKRSYEYSSEIERLTVILQQSGQELQEQRQRHQVMQSALQQKQSVEHDSERMRIFFQENEQVLQVEIQRLGAALHASMSQITVTQQTLMESHQWEGRFKQQIQESQQLTNELEGLNRLLIQKSEEFQSERKRWIQEIEGKNSQLQDYQIQISRVQQSYQNQIRQLSTEYDERHSVEVRQRNEEVTRLSQITQTLQIALQDTTKYDESEQRAKYQGEEIARLNQSLRQRTDEADKLRQQLGYVSQEMQEMQRYVEFESKYVAAFQEIERLSKTIKSKIEENEHLRTCISKLQITLNDNAKLMDYENKIALLSQEIERLHQSLKSRVEELERTRSQITHLQEDATLEVTRLTNLVRSKNEEIERYKYAITQTVELHRLKDSEGKVALLSTELERLTVQLRNKNDEIETFKHQMTLMQTQMQTQTIDSTRTRDLENKNTIYGQEIERLNHILKIKLGEFEQFRQAYVKLESQQKFDQQDLVQEVRSADQRLKDVLARYLLLAAENERLNGVLRHQLDEVEVGRRQQSSGQSERINVLTQELDSWKQQFIILNREYHKNQECLILSQAELDSMKNKKSTVMMRESEFLTTQQQENIFQKERKSQVQVMSSTYNYQIGTLTHRNI